MTPQILIPGTSISTSRIGFGCTALMGSLGLRESLELLDTALDVGIKHFDVAPVYGFGEAERCLGAFLKRHRSADITVTTKYGLRPPRRFPLLNAARRVAGPIIKAFPVAKRHLLKAADAIVPPGGMARFSVAEAAASLHNSLKALGRDRIDVFLLHEVSEDQLTDEELLHFLTRSVEKGDIGSFGIGSDISKVSKLVAVAPAYCHILQFEWCIRSPLPANASRFCILHRSLGQNLQRLWTTLSNNPSRAESWSRDVGLDLLDYDQLAAISIRAPLAINHQSIVLASSKNRSHVAENARAAADGSIDDSILKLRELLANASLIQ